MGSDEFPRDRPKRGNAFGCHAHRRTRMLASFERGVLASPDSVGKHPGY